MLHFSRIETWCIYWGKGVEPGIVKVWSPGKLPGKSTVFAFSRLLEDAEKILELRDPKKRMGKNGAVEIPSCLDGEGWWFFDGVCEVVFMDFRGRIWKLGRWNYGGVNELDVFVGLYIWWGYKILRRWIHTDVLHSFWGIELSERLRDA